MLDRLRTLFRRLAWDARISWRLSGGNWYPFRGVPDDVVQRWADKGGWLTEEQLDAVLKAWDELESRQHRWVPSQEERSC